jgi:hypothetical protein
MHLVARADMCLEQPLSEPLRHLASGLLEREVCTYLLWLVATANFQTSGQRSMYVKPLPVSLPNPISQSVKCASLLPATIWPYYA